MVNERYDDKGADHHEEGEYHFSDDHANYDMEPELAKSDTGSVASAKENFFGKVKQYRRMIVGSIIFLILLALVYKTLVPSNTVPETDFSQAKPVAAFPAAKPASVDLTAAATQAEQNAQQPVVPVQSPQITVSASPGAPQVMPGSPSGMTSPTQNAPPPPPASVAERLATVEQQNSMIMNLVQTQYAQKLADFQTQNDQLRGQVQELNNRVAAMEVAFHQLTKILRSMSRQASNSAVMTTQTIRSSSPSNRAAYTVQAIIPGRAWLKSDSGDTVTVAEGDVLKDYGRVTKIDPYDGVVNINAGGKVITLSYGTNGDS